MEDQETNCIAKYNLFGESLETLCIYSPEDEFHFDYTLEELKDEGCVANSGCYHHEYKPDSAQNLPEGYY